MKDIELKLIAELMKNSRRSDRELAKAIGISQPTVSRTIRKLEKEGYLGQYTLIPNLSRLGYRILAITFVKVRQTITPEEREKARGLAKEVLKKGPYEIVMGERGIGLGCDGVFLSYHESYAEYAKLKEWFRQFEFLEVGSTGSYLVDLEDKVRYRPLDFTPLAYHLVMKKEKEK
jgi:DNA-binding Lrp family transcriptional regulator